MLKYFNHNKHFVRLLFSFSLLILIYSIICILDTINPDPEYFEGFTSSIIDDLIVLIFITIACIICLIGSLLFRRRYKWVWFSIYLANLIVAALSIIYFIGWLIDESISYYAWAPAMFYVAFAIYVHLNIRRIEIKDMFRIWEWRLLGFLGIKWL